MATSNNEPQEQGATSTSVDTPVTGSGGEKSEQYNAQEIAQDPSRAPEQENVSGDPTNASSSDKQQQTSTQTQN